MLRATAVGVSNRTLAKTVGLSEPSVSPTGARRVILDPASRPFDSRPWRVPLLERSPATTKTWRGDRVRLERPWRTADRSIRTGTLAESSPTWTAAALSLTTSLRGARRDLEAARYRVLTLLPTLDQRALRGPTLEHQIQTCSHGSTASTIGSGVPMAPYPRSPNCGARRCVSMDDAPTAAAAWRPLAAHELPARHSRRRSSGHQSRDRRTGGDLMAD